MARASEFETIERYFAPLSAAAPGAYGLSNDAAVWCPNDGCEAVITTDCMVAGVHFLPDDPPDLIAEKLLAVNLSDIAAMGARPTGYTLAVAWPRDIDETWIAGFSQGLERAQTKAHVSLLGGDTVGTPGPLTLSLTALGEVPTGEALSRSGANPGDSVYVTGTIGDAALGLQVLIGTLEPQSAADRDALVRRYRQPEARIGVGVGLSGIASAAIDISDGLAADLGHVAKQSIASIEVEAAAIPLSVAACACVDKEPALWGAVFGGGDDYELAFTASPAHAAEIETLARSADTPITRIGVIKNVEDDEPGVWFVNPDGSVITIEQSGFRHF
ncbi:MAG: thiamine-phosphate kinase [Rhodospirillaceae bacterium]|jgi:thiamine-monophosphate kinase|nr:thiamine-phosphate kinase [Rhodospirillaceae bacterium]